MKSLILKLYHKVSDWGCVKVLVNIYRNGFFITNWRAYLRLKNTKRNLESRQLTDIKVVFLCQNTQIWGKQQPVYEKMIQDSRFDVSIIAVPEFHEENNENQTYQFLVSLGYQNVINAKTETGWADLKAMNPYYVFYPRPYDQYLPGLYKSKVVSKYAKICYLPYAYSMTPDIAGICLAKLFLRNVYLFFAEVSYYKEFNIRRMKYSHRVGVRKSVSVGYPTLERFAKCNSSEHKDLYHILWTPRWSTDKEVGGSNFLVYKDKIVDFVDKNKKFALTFRPHPLTFYHFLSTGQITEEQLSAYRKRYDRDRYTLDEESDYLETFRNADVMVTDFSSMLVEFYVTKKPIIYCDTGAGSSDFFNRVLEGCYVTHTFAEVEKILADLEQGVDPLKKTREEVIDSLFGKELEGVAERMIDVLVKDSLQTQEAG